MINGYNILVYIILLFHYYTNNNNIVVGRYTLMGLANQNIYYFINCYDRLRADE
ncbi:hypothetical protein T492DRAFT_992011 [Pavlovales sp. CCMP2436]|nr:hypothetical protein T492DRAFT_992011 [Pavlovales sp. CCMP2436]